MLDVDRVGRPSSAAAFNALPASEAATRLAAPLVRNRHTPADLSSGIQVQNPDPAAAATVRLAVFDPDGNPLPASPELVVPPGGVAGWFLPAVPGIADRPGFYGSAILESDRPVVAVVADLSLNGRSDGVAYTALPTADVGAGIESRLAQPAIGGVRP